MNVRQNILALLLSLTAAATVAQDKWKHERIYVAASGIERSTRYMWVNAAGDIAYSLGSPRTVYPHAFRNYEDLNARYLPRPSEGYALGLNETGQAALYGHTQGQTHLIVDGRDFYQEVYGATDLVDAMVAGVDANGVPIWSAHTASNVSDRLYHGTVELSHGIFVTYSTLHAWSNSAGQVVWEGTTSTGDHVFLGDVNYSEMVLGPGMVGREPRINERGDILWEGSDKRVGGHPKLYLNDKDVSSALFPNATIINPSDINNNHILWVVRSGGKYYTMLDSTPIGSFLPPEYEVSQSAFMNESGDVFFTSIGGGTLTFWRNQDNLSDAVLGQLTIDDVYLDKLGIDRYGNALWHGSGTKTNHKTHVFVNSFDLTMDALGNDDYEVAWGMKIGESGHVLWQVINNDNTRDLWLSTPVPEPSSFLLLFGGGAAVWRRGRRVANMQ